MNISIKFSAVRPGQQASPEQHALPDELYQLCFIMPQKIIQLTKVNADIVIKEQTEYNESVRHLIT